MTAGYDSQVTYLKLTNGVTKIEDIVKEPPQDGLMTEIEEIVEILEIL